MSFFERYINFEDGRLIFAEIDKLGSQVFSDKYRAEVLMVLNETFTRLAFNLDLIFSELTKIDYCFTKKFTDNSDKPISKPLYNVNLLLQKFEGSVSDFGYVPLSLKMFYKVVGSCNFAWDTNHNFETFWPLADPIQINSLDNLVSYVSEDDWKEYLTETLEDEDNPIPFVELAADFYHKDNISGGLAYSIQLTKKESIDSLFLNELHQTTFINYLRICMENCGFSRVDHLRTNKKYNDFCNRVKPLLKAI